MSQRLAVARRLIGPGIFLLLAVAVTWPFAIHPGSTTSAFIGGDVTISIQKFRLLVDEGLSPFREGKFHTIGWSDGIAHSPTIDTVSWINTLYLWLGSRAIGSIATHGLMSLLGMLLTATLTAVFVSEVTRSRLAGFVAGIAYGFFAHMIVVAWAASTYTWMFLLLLPLWAVWRLGVQPTVRRALVAGLAYLPALFWTPYYGEHAGVVAAASLLVFVLVRAHEDVTWRRRVALAAVAVVPWVIGLGAYLAIGAANDFTGVPDPPESDHYEQSAHPLMYLVPGANALLWGNEPSTWLVERVPRAAGVQLYLGITTLVLAAIGLVTALRPWVRARARSADPAALAALMALAVALAAFLCSLPPRVWGHRLPTPSALILAVEPGLRAGQRFVMPLMAGVAVLAGLGAWYLLKRFAARPAAAVALAAALAALVFLDTHTQPQGRWERTPAASPSLAKLKALPPGPALHWHYSGFLPVPAPRACFMQPQHGKVLVNDCAIRLERNPPLLVWSGMEVCDAVVDVSTYGVRYLIVDAARADVVDCLRTRDVPARLVGRDRQLSVYAFS